MCCYVCIIYSNHQFRPLLVIPPLNLGLLHFPYPLLHPFKSFIWVSQHEASLNVKHCRYCQADLPEFKKPDVSGTLHIKLLLLVITLHRNRMLVSNQSFHQIYKYIYRYLQTMVTIALSVGEPMIAPCCCAITVQLLTAWSVCT